MSEPVPEPRECRLAQAAGLSETCPGSSCLFSDEAVCILGSLGADLGENRPLVHHLLGLRRAVEAAPAREPALPGLGL